MKKWKKISIGLLFALMLMVIGGNPATAFTEDSYHHQTELEIKLNRPHYGQKISNTAVETEQSYEKAKEEVPDERYYGVLPQTGNKEDRLLLLVGFIFLSVTIMTFIIRWITYFKRKEQENV